MTRAAAGPVDTPRLPFRPATLLLFGGIAAATLLTWLSRLALNPDGVSYLDLARQLREGEWASFVQGYWSPLYPALVAFVTLPLAPTPASSVVASHVLNGLAVTGAMILLYRWGARHPVPRFGVAALLGFLLVSGGLPRIEGVTPDTILLSLMAWLAYEMLARTSTRWVLTGALLGAAYLLKTSAWPWLLLSVPLRWLGASAPAERRDVLRSSAVAGAVALLWVIPLSHRAGTFTAGSAARLNYCWYLEGCDSRTPDTHHGDHVAYHVVPVDPGRRVTWAEFTDAGAWTYQPWGDPTAWEEGVRTRHGSAPSPRAIVAATWFRTEYTFGRWLLPVLLVVVLPWFVLEWSPSARRGWRGEARRAYAHALLGLLGISQFLVVHTEPRLFAPFALLLVLAILQGSGAGAPAQAPGPRRWRGAIDLLGCLVLVGFIGVRFRGGPAAATRLSHNVTGLAAANTALAAQGLSQSRIVILGPAMAASAAAFFSDAHVVAQVLPDGVGVLFDRPGERQQVLLARLFGGRAQVAWLTDSSGGVTLVRIPPDTLTALAWAASPP